eukprot:Cvel_30713.t1-p1 / transcript=Cvel_30713.t1 / gene=Cvel_30713 / organism=Chromera_velia_CCMP2878 / gene_product=Transposon Ty3-I Gag-Pol polyprotein, putative / transcript_product=Transposon Ty3-I Gag-Pol polyprotein, putative / location=Cvel_scaffold4432:1-3365(-) / protein_length=1017 / sequence_SO=supercontig / SO=protein_coding / is_pseudo=false
MWQPAARPVTDFPPGLWGSQQQNQNTGMRNGYPFRRYYSTKTSRAPRKLIRFHGWLAGVPVRCLYDPGADSNFLAHSVAESNRFTLWDLDEPTACKGRLNGGPQLPISQEVKGLPLCIQGFSTPLDLTVVDLDDDYDVVLGMPFCEEYIPISHYREKALTIPACESPTGRDLLLLDSEEYPAEGEGEDFFSQRELHWLMKRPSSRMHLFRLEAVRKGGVSDTLGVHSLQSASKPGDPQPLSFFPPDHPINSSTYTGFRKHLQSKEVPPSVQPVLEKHFDRFPDELPGLPPHRKIECEIKLEAGHSPPARAPYRLSYGQLDELRRQLDSYLEKGHIYPSTSLYAAPVLFVQKADGTQRMCIDFTGLNKITARDKFPIPHPEELLSRLHGAKFFSSLDLRQYFHQTRIREGDEEKTAFVTSRTPEEHIEHINQVLSLLREHQLYVKVSKCAWLRTEAKFLGLVVDQKGVRPSHEKMQGLTEFAQPTDRTSLHQFLGLANWFRRFVPRFSFLAGPLTFLLQGNVPFEWKTAQSCAFAELKKAVQEHATLALPDPSKPVILVPDASQSAGAIGAVALQKDCATGRYRPLAFGSRRLTSTEAKYPVRELEFLAIVHFAKPVGSLGAEFADLPDLVPEIEESQTPVKEGDGQQSRVGMELQSLMVSATQSQAFLDACRRGYSADPFFYPVLQHLSQQHPPAPTPDFTFRLRGMSLRAGLLYFEGNRLCVPRSQQGTVMAGVHSPPHAAHFGMGKTYRKVASLYYWPKMWRSVASFIRTCDRCQRSKGPTAARPGLLQPLPIPSRPWESTCIDRLTDLPPSGDEGFDAILVVLCRLIKAVVLIPTHSTAGAEETARIYRQYVSCKKGFQRHIVCDRDPRFVARFWQTLHASSGSEVDFATASHHDTAGAAERMSRTLEEALRCLVDTKHSRWSEFLCDMEFAYSSSVHEGTGFAPLTLDGGKSPLIPPALNLPVSVEPSFNAREFLEEHSQMIAAARDRSASRQSGGCFACWEQEAPYHSHIVV